MQFEGPGNFFWRNGRFHPTQNLPYGRYLILQAAETQLFSIGTAVSSLTVIYEANFTNRSSVNSKMVRAYFSLLNLSLLLKWASI